MPQIDYPVSMGQMIGNGRPTKSGDVGQVDDYQSWLAMAAHPQLPTILTGTNSSSTIGGTATKGFRSTTTSSWSDWVYIDLIVPPFVNYMAWGVTAVGSGQIRAHTDMSGQQYMLTMKSTKYALASDDMVTQWAELCKVGYTANEPVAADLTAVGKTGSRIPRITRFKYQIQAKYVASFTVIALHFRYVSPPAGTNTTGFANTGAGGTDL